MFFKSANTLQLSLDSNDVATSTTFTDIGRWYHIAIVQDDANNDQQIYVDGVLDTSGTVDVDLDNAVASFTIGCNFNGTTEEFIGYMCNVGVWSRALTQPEIKSIMWKQHADLSTSEKTSLVSWWNLDTDANDSHGSNNGTLS